MITMRVKREWKENYVQRLLRAMKTLPEKAVRQIYPNRCPVCNRVPERGRLICPSCARKLAYVRQPCCCKCGRPLADMRQEYCGDCRSAQHEFAQGRAVWIYQGHMRRILYRYKYGNRRDYAEFFAAEAYRVYGGFIRTAGIEAVIPVPLHKKRQKKRGYNQAELFAGRLCALCGVPLENRLLYRVKNTAPLKKLSAKERKNNLKKAFKVGKNIVKLKRVLLVDDIYTTGSTLNAAAAVLKEAGVGEVYVLCISIGSGFD